MMELIQAAKDIIELRYEKGKHSVGAAVRTKNGKIYTGVCINSQKLDVCSEWVAFGKALTEGEKEFEMTVAVHRDIEGNFDIYPPCALCRELYLTYCPDISVVLPGEEVLVASELLPKAWTRKK